MLLEIEMFAPSITGLGMGAPLLLVSLTSPHGRSAPLNSKSKIEMNAFMNAHKLRRGHGRRMLGRLPALSCFLCCR